MEKSSEIMQLYLLNFSAVGKFKSVRRAIRRGNVTMDGMVVPNKPYKCKANTCTRKGHHSRKINDLKRRIYNGIRTINNRGV